MRIQRIALVAGLVLALTALVPSFNVGTPPDGSPPVVPIVVLILTIVLAVIAVATIVPAWRGSRRAAVGAASVQLVGSITALPAFFAPADALPPGGVAAASIFVIISVLVVAGILLPVSTATLHVVTALLAIAVFALLTAITGALLPERAERAAQTVAALTVAIAYAPGLRLLRRTIGQALYGGRVDPSGTARSVGERLRAETGSSPGEVLEELRSALRLPRLVLQVGGDVVAVAGAGAPLATAPSEELVVDAAHAAVLDVMLRPGEVRLGRDDRAALELVLPALALLLRTRELAIGLAEARTATVEARERERSGLHRELHDGLGPVLTGALYRADAARRQIDSSPDAAVATLDAAREELRAAVASVRRVAYGLRPIELEEHGLWGALTRQAGAHGRVTVHVSLCAHRPQLTPAIELAAFRVATEAVSNAARHSTGSRVDVAVDARGGALVIRVVDDGTPPSRWREGIGLASLRDRVTELRGHVEAGPADHGWRVEATIPLAGS